MAAERGYGGGGGSDYVESIYNLIPKIEEKPPKPQMYRSNHTSTVKNEYKANKKGSKTMGPPKVASNEPKNFLTKRSKEFQLPEKTAFKYPDNDQRRPPVPKHTEKPLMGLQSNKNHVTTNAVENIMSVPKKPEKKICRHSRGSHASLGAIRAYSKVCQQERFWQNSSLFGEEKGRSRACTTGIRCLRAGKIPTRSNEKFNRAAKTRYS